MSSSIRDKTVRPGSLNGYSYYHSGQQRPVETVKSEPNPKSKRKIWPLVLIILVVGFWLGFHNESSTDKGSKQPATPAVSTQASVTQANGINNCETNNLDKLIKISIDKRKMWACEKSKSVYSAPVITGLKDHPETETPLGTYKIYGKTTNTTLKGSDSRGAWSDPVYYWIPFLDNQYGTYGFHDATWRSESDFGKISPQSEEASHGCIELPLAASKWLYDWAPVGTTVTVES